jgi:hypothetical protein
MREAIDRSIVVFDQPVEHVMSRDPSGVLRIGHPTCDGGATCLMAGSLAWASRGALLTSFLHLRAVVDLPSSRRADPNGDAILARG